MTSSMPKRRGAPTNYGAMQIFNAMPSSVVDKNPAAARRAAEKVADENRARTYIPSSDGQLPRLPKLQIQFPLVSALGQSAAVPAPQMLSTLKAVSLLPGTMG